MVKFFDKIPDILIPWIKEQKMFWVATAPLSESGHVNLSPKGFEGTFHIQDENTVWYEDMTGSGVETIAHARENGRMTIMFCAFEGPPRIVRLFGHAQVFEFDSPEYNSLIPLDKRVPGSRSVILLNVHKASSSCGYSIPFYSFKSHRMRLHNFLAGKEEEDIKAETCTDISVSPTDIYTSATAEHKSGREVEIAGGSSISPPLPQGGLKWYWKHRNHHSIDGLPGIHTAYTSKQTFNQNGVKDWGTDDERVPADFQLKSKSAVENWVDRKIVLGFILGLLVSGLWIHLVDHFGLVVKAL